MDAVVDVVVTLVEWASRSPLGMIVLTAPVWLLAAFAVRRWWMRRRRVQAFAAAHGLEYVGTIPSDTRLPYTRVPDVSLGVLLSNVMEGRWDGLAVAVCDAPQRNRADWTVILITMDDLLQIGPATQQALAAHPEAVVEAYADVAAVTPRRPLDVSELSAWLSFAATVARAMARDAQEAFTRNAATPAPAPDRPLFGHIGEG